MNRKLMVVVSVFLTGIMLGCGGRRVMDGPLPEQESDIGLENTTCEDTTGEPDIQLHDLSVGGTGTDQICGLREDGRVVCWHPSRSCTTDRSYIDISKGGGNECGVLGDGSAECVFLEQPPADTNFKQVSAGGRSACGITDSDEVVCWGQLNYDLADPPSGEFDQIIGKDWTYCGLQKSGEIVCWGQTGQNTASDSELPEGPFADLAFGQHHGCGLTEDGTLKCWGVGTDPETDEGENDFDQASLPDGTYKDVAAGRFHTCAIKESGEVVCRGHGNGPDTDGEAPNGKFGHADNDQSVPPDGTYKAISANGYTNCALDETGRPTCWGGPWSETAE